MNLNLDENDLRLLDNYAKSRLTTAEQAVFATRYRENADFRAEARTRRALMETFFQEEKSRFQKEAAERATKKRLVRMLVVAAAIGLAAAVGYLFWIKPPASKPPFLFEPMKPMVYATRNGKAVEMPEAFEFYGKNQFAEAAAAFEKMSPPTDTILIFETSALLACKPPRVKEAFEVLKKIDGATRFSAEKNGSEQTPSCSTVKKQQPNQHLKPSPPTQKQLGDASESHFENRFLTTKGAKVCTEDSKIFFEKSLRSLCEPLCPSW